MKTIRTPFHSNPHCNGIPIGRLAEVLASFSVEEKSRLVLRQRKANACGDGYDILRAKTRELAVAAVERERSNPPPYFLSLVSP
jgi:hypothetical protein